MTASRLNTFFLGIIVVFMVGVFLRLAKPVLFPFFLAVFISLFHSPALLFFHRRKIPKVISIILILIVTFVALYLLGILSYSTGKAFVSEFPKYSQKITSLLESFQVRFKLSPEQWDPKELMKRLDMSKVGSILLASLGPFFSFLSKVFLILIFLIFILAGRGRMRKKITGNLNKSRASQITEVIDNIDREIQKYLSVKTLISFVTGLLATIVLIIFGVDFAIVFGFLTFVLNYIPQIGSVIATALPVIIAIFQFNTIWPALGILLLLFTIQMIMGNFIEPRMMGEGLGLSPLVVLFSLFFWGWLWGIEGMVLAVPLTAGIKIVCRNIPTLEPVALLMRKDIIISGKPR